MKKNFIIAFGIFFSMITLFSSCGDGGAAEKEAARLDSIRKADSVAALMLEQHLKDSLMQDSIMKAQAYADSVAAAMNAAGNKGGTTKTNTTTTKTTATTTVTTAPTTTTTGRLNTTSGGTRLNTTGSTDGKTGGGRLNIGKGGN